MSEGTGMDTISDDEPEVTLGIDTHLDQHAAAALDPVGRPLGTISVPATAAGYEQLLTWASAFGLVTRAGVEGTGCYGAGVARFLQAAGVEVIEVTRAARADRRHLGKTDPLDAQAAARVVLAGTAKATPKQRSGIVESIRLLRAARQTAVKARSQAVIQIKSILVSAPDDLRAELRPLKAKQLVDRCANARPGAGRDPLTVTKRVLRSVARRHRMLDAEIAALEAELDDLVALAAPRLLAQHSVGRETAAKLLTLAGDNPERLRNHSALAALCGASPVEASSGKTTRHRLNRGGDRQANNALYTIAMVRMQHHPETKAYVARRTHEGKTRREIRRCLMRNLARRLFPLLIADLNDAKTIPLLT
jgi:transposase